MSRTFHLNGGYRILSALILVFIISWTPYNILSILKVILRVNQSSTVRGNLLGRYTIKIQKQIIIQVIPQGLWDTAYGLMYINSTINPFCYAMSTPSFRRGWTRLIKKRILGRRGDSEQANETLSLASNSFRTPDSPVQCQDPGDQTTSEC